MLYLSAEWVVAIYVGIFLVVVLGAWFVSQRGKIRKFEERSGGIIRCAQCATRYRDDSGAELPICPCCGSPNERS